MLGVGSTAQFGRSSNITRGSPPSKIRAERARIARQGFYAASSDTAAGVTDLCAPVFAHGEGAVAALTVPALPQKEVSVSVDAAREARVTATARISAHLAAGAVARQA